MKFNAILSELIRLKMSTEKEKERFSKFSIKEVPVFKKRPNKLLVASLIASLSSAYFLLSFSHHFHYSLVFPASYFTADNVFCHQVYSPYIYFLDYTFGALGTVMVTFLYKFHGTTTSLLFVLAMAWVNSFLMVSAFHSRNCLTLMVSALTSSINLAVCRCIGIFVVIHLVHWTKFGLVIAVLLGYTKYFFTLYFYF